jgi:hypothetical protein
MGAGRAGALVGPAAALRVNRAGEGTRAPGVLGARRRRPPFPAWAAAVALAAAAAFAGASGTPAPPSGVVPRFAVEPNPIALAGPASAARFMEASGRRAAFLGREDGSFEAWAYPLKVLHDFQLAFAIAAYAEPIPAASLAATVDIRPESATVRYSHAAFTVDATWLVPLDEPGGLVLLDVHASEPVTVLVRFRPDLKPMWPAALGGQYCGWNGELNAFVLTEGSRRAAAVVGSPLATAPPEQPAHNLPDAPVQMAIPLTPQLAARGLVPIAIAASVRGRDDATAACARLLAGAEGFLRESAAHYRRLRTERTSLDTPDDRLDLAFEWGKVALDKGFVCNPQLGAGLIAGLGPSGASERPGFGWFFGGDAFINAAAIDGYGDFALVAESLRFLRARQRDDGKMMHELSQGAAYIRWFEEYPYGYYHADTTALYIAAVRDHVAASGDLALARELWPSVRRAFEFCELMDEDGDGLMDNSLAGLAAVETGKLRSRDVMTDVFLAAAWADAAAAAADLAAVAEPAFGARAAAAAARARAALNERFLDDEGRRVHFALDRGGLPRDALTVWPAYGIARGVFDAGRPAIAGALDALAGAAIGADWGARMLSRESALYEPLSYNNGASWPFLTGFAAQALYAARRAPAAWAYLDGLADVAFLEARGFLPELLSGDRLRSVDAAVPHQLFATTGLMATVTRGLIGLGAAAAPGEPVLGPGAAVRMAPQLPPEWRSACFANLAFRSSTFDLRVEQAAGRIAATVVRHGGPPLPVELELTLPPGARLSGRRGGERSTVGAATPRGTPVRFTARVAGEARFEVRWSGGCRVWAPHPPLALGDRSRRLRIVDAVSDGEALRVRVEGLAGERYELRAEAPGGIAESTGAVDLGSEAGVTRLEVTLPAAGAEWTAGDIMLRLAGSADRLRRRAPSRG